MIDGNVPAAIEESIAEILEKMFFIPVENGPLPEHDPGLEIAAELSFLGEPSGSLRLYLSRDTARSIAADFLGGEAGEICDRQTEEVVCELSNMVCGAVLSRVESTTTFHLESPHIVPRSDPAPLMKNVACHAVVIGNGLLTVILQTESPLCPKIEKSVF